VTQAQPTEPLVYIVVAINLSSDFLQGSNFYKLLTRIIQSLYYAPAGRYINAWMHSLKKSVKPEIVNRYDLLVLRHKIGGAKVFVNNVQWSDQMM
jgi:hypothetical protein